MNRLSVGDRVQIIKKHCLKKQKHSSQYKNKQTLIYKVKL